MTNKYYLKILILILLSFIFLNGCHSPTSTPTSTSSSTFTSISTSIPHSFVDKNIAGLIVGENEEKDIVKLFGKGTYIFSEIEKQYFYYDRNTNVIFEISIHPDESIADITLKKVNSKPKYIKTYLNNNIRLVTGKGIKIGDSSEKILSIYGKPHKKKVKGNKMIFEYHTDYNNDPQVTLAYDAYLTFVDDKLSEIIIHDGE